MPNDETPDDDATTVFFPELDEGCRGDASCYPDGWPRPSNYTDDFFLHAHLRPEARPGQLAYPRATPRCGKWLIFAPTAEVDAWWKRVRRALAAGQLGSSAKVSGRRPNPHGRPGQHVICVYTYDGEDQADVMRVREALRAIGVTQRISYKLDSATLAGQYAGDGGPVSRYRV
jgi:hypothetical protein